MISISSRVRCSLFFLGGIATIPPIFLGVWAGAAGLSTKILGLVSQGGIIGGRDPLFTRRENRWDWITENRSRRRGPGQALHREKRPAQRRISTLFRRGIPDE